MEDFKKSAEKYGIKPAEDVLEEATKIREHAAVSLTSGLLLKTFKTTAEKVALRDGVVKALKILSSRGLSATLLPSALKSRSDQALSFKLNL